MLNNKISYEQYKNIKSKYSHIASFAYWPLLSKGAEDIIAENEEEFTSKSLNNMLHADSVFLGINLGRSKEINELIDSGKVRDIVEYYRSINNMSNQYGKKYAYKALMPQIKGTKLEGSYMTDFYKFPLEDNELTGWRAYGMPTSNAADLIKDMKSRGNSYIEDLINNNAKGLYYELYQIVGIQKDPNFIIFGKMPYFEKVLNAILKYFPNSQVVKMPHYQAYGISKEQFGKEVQKVLGELNKK